MTKYYEEPPYLSLEKAINEWVHSSEGQGFAMKNFILSIDMIDLENPNNLSTTTYIANKDCGAPVFLGLMELTTDNYKRKIYGQD